MSDLTTAAVCGLYCKSCSVYIGTMDNDEQRLERIGRTMNQSIADTRCEGCRSNVLSAHCRTCTFRSCAEGKNIRFCGECSEFPCAKLAEFQKQLPHRVELYQSLALLKDADLEQWHQQMISDYSCPECGTINSAYDYRCRNCGNEPGNPYIERNRDWIRRHLRIDQTP